MPSPMAAAVISRRTLAATISASTSRPSAEMTGVRAGTATSALGRARVGLAPTAKPLGRGRDAVAQLLPRRHLVRHHPVHLDHLAWAHILFVPVEGAVRAAEHQKRAELRRHL